MFLPVWPLPPSQLSTTRHWSSSRKTLLALVFVPPGAETAQSPSQKSSWRLSALAEHGGWSGAAAAEPTAIKLIDTIRAELNKTFLNDSLFFMVDPFPN